MDKAFALSKKFIFFATVGFALMVGYSIINWYFIDFLGYDSTLIAPVGLFLFFFLKYQAYVAFQLIHAKFARYCMANLGLFLISATAIPIVIKQSPLNAFWSTTITLCIMVMLRFAVFYSFKLIR